MEDYKGYFISGLALPTYLTGRKPKSLGIILKTSRLGYRSAKSSKLRHPCGLELSSCWLALCFPKGDSGAIPITRRQATDFR